MSDHMEIIAATRSAPPAATARPPGALVANILTVLLLLGIPLIGLVAVWTIAPWDRRARVVVSAIFAFPALYPPVKILITLTRQAFGV